jgi:hypothetical protein
VSKNYISNCKKVGTHLEKWQENNNQLLDKTTKNNWEKDKKPRKEKTTKTQPG